MKQRKDAACQTSAAHWVCWSFLNNAPLRALQASRPTLGHFQEASGEAGPASCTCWWCEPAVRQAHIRTSLTTLSSTHWCLGDLSQSVQGLGLLYQDPIGPETDLDGIYLFQSSGHKYSDSLEIWFFVLSILASKPENGVLKWFLFTQAYSVLYSLRQPRARIEQWILPYS